MRDDNKMTRWVAEIHLRACARIGELSRDLEKAQSARDPKTKRLLPTGRRKAAALAEAGISISTAHDYEALTGGTDANAQKAATAGMELYLADGNATKTTPTMKAR